MMLTKTNENAGAFYLYQETHSFFTPIIYTFFSERILSELLSSQGQKRINFVCVKNWEKEKRKHQWLASQTNFVEDIIQRHPLLF